MTALLAPEATTAITVLRGLGEDQRARELELKLKFRAALSETPKSLDTFTAATGGARSSTHRALSALTAAGIAEHVRGGWKVADPNGPVARPKPRKAKRKPPKPPKPARRPAKVAQLDVARAARHRAQRERDERRARSAQGCNCSRPIVGADEAGDPCCALCGRAAS